VKGQDVQVNLKVKKDGNFEASTETVGEKRVLQVNLYLLDSIFFSSRFISVNILQSVSWIWINEAKILFLSRFDHFLK